MTTVLLDTHVVHWWSAEPERLSERAADLIDAADAVVVASITWYELAWLAGHGRIALTIPVDAWLDRLSRDVGTVVAPWRTSLAAASLPASFAGDPADRLIYATALVRGYPLVTKDRRLRDHPEAGNPAVW